MTLFVRVEEDGLKIHSNPKSSESPEEVEATEVMEIDCADFRQFLSDAKSGKFDTLV